MWGECCFQPAFVEALRVILGHYNARVEVIDRDPNDRRSAIGYWPPSMSVPSDGRVAAPWSWRLQASG